MLFAAAQDFLMMGLISDNFSEEEILYHQKKEKENFKMLLVFIVS